MLASFLGGFLGVLFVVVCLLLILIVLLQKGRGGGLGAAFGGAGSSAFGTKTGDVFTWITIVLTGLFLLLAIITSFVYRPDVGQVGTPVARPAGKTIASPLTVQLVSSTSRATIHYTVGEDPPAPTEDSPSRPNGASIKVRPGQTLRLRAYRKGWEPSELVTEIYARGTTQPATQDAAATAPAGG